MNPLDMPGPEFLTFYVVLFLAAVAGAACLRWLLRQPGDAPLPEALALSPYEVAYLSGGEEQVVNAAIARLVHEDALAVDSINRKLTARGDGPPTDASELERAVYSAVKGDAAETVAAVRAAAASKLAPVRRRVYELGLLVLDDQAEIARFLPLFLVLLVPLFGVVKIFVGISRDRPVLFLVMLCIISVIVAVLGFGRSVHRGRRGDRALAQLRADNSALEYQIARRADELSGDDLVLAVGLFGIGVLAGAGGPLGRLPSALRAPSPLSTTAASTSNSSSGCGFFPSWTSSCGGASSCGGGGSSCGGGGCGGCGGGGCGG
jgi:uncharacterized protein (TIGR04222 family)